MRQGLAEGVANITSLPTGIAKLGSGCSEARFGCGRCLFNDSAQGMAKQWQRIVKQGLAEGVANITSLPTGIAKLGSVYSEARFDCGRCLFYDSAHGMAKLGHGIVRQVIAECVAGSTTPRKEWQNWGSV